ncbi:MAG: cytoplasmic protein [Deltaproteobacteria bacterium]|nr:cytoplasmic protein [Deltaproteobacteria bacterium]
MGKPDYIKAHKFSSNHRSQVESSERCECFHCPSVFQPTEIREWIKEPQGGETAICPKCGIDSIIGSNSGFPITKQFLSAMSDYWFSSGQQEASTEVEGVRSEWDR